MTRIFFLLIHNNKKIPSTLKSRCLNFRIALPHHKINEIIQKLLNSDITHLVNNELLDYYYTQGKIYNLLLFANENNIDLENIKLEDTLICYLHANLCNLLSAGIKLIPLGQTEGQRIQIQLNLYIEEEYKIILGKDMNDIGNCGWVNDIVSMQHENQFTRIFRT